MDHQSYHGVSWSGCDKLLAKLHKMGTTKRKHGSGRPRKTEDCVMSGMRGGEKMDILNSEYDSDCDTNSTDLDCLKCASNFICVHIIDIINFLE